MSEILDQEVQDYEFFKDAARKGPMYTSQICHHSSSKSFVIGNMWPVASAILVFAMLFFQLSVRLRITEQAYRVEELRASVLKRDELLREAELEYAMVSDPIFIERQAAVRLKMAVTPPQRIRQLSVASKTFAKGDKA